MGIRIRWQDLLLAATLAATTASAQLEYVFPKINIAPTPEQAQEDKRRQDADRAKQAEAARQAAVEAEREKKAVAQELKDRGWPASRADEARRLLRLKQEAEAARSRWTGQPLADAELTAADAKAQAPAPKAKANTAPSKCRTVEAPPALASGFGRSRDAALAAAMSKTQGCKVLNTNCTSSWSHEFDKAGRHRRVEGSEVFDCRVSYSCGKTREACESRPAAASSQ